MPVLPLVGSTIVVLPGRDLPRSSASTIIDTPMRSFTLKPGVNDSSFAKTVAPAPSVTRFRRTSGVLPISSRGIIGDLRADAADQVVGALDVVLITLSYILRSQPGANHTDTARSR